MVYATFNHLASGVANKHKIYLQSSGLVYKPHLRFSFKYNFQAVNQGRGKSVKSRANNTTATCIDNNVCLFYDFLSGPMNNILNH